MAALELRRGDGVALVFCDPEGHTLTGQVPIGQCHIYHDHAHAPGAGVGEELQFGPLGIAENSFRGKTGPVLHIVHPHGFGHLLRKFVGRRRIANDLGQDVCIDEVDALSKLITQHLKERCLARSIAPCDEQHHRARIVMRLQDLAQDALQCRVVEFDDGPF